MQKIQKMVNAAEAQGKPIKDRALLEPVSKEIISVTTMAKPDPTETQFERLIKTLLKNYKDEKFLENEQVIKDLQFKNVFWTNQVYQTLYVFKKDENDFIRMMRMLLARVKDWHNRFLLVEHFKGSAARILSTIKTQMGQAFTFNFFNPNGHYRLNLVEPEQREVAKCLMLMNKQISQKIAAGELCDRSQRGNKSCLRNERYAEVPFLWSPEYVLPKKGWIEFDFVYLTPIRPEPEDEVHPEEMSLLIRWFQEKYQTILEAKAKLPGLKFDGQEMAEVFRGISEQFVFSTQQLILLLDVIDGKLPNSFNPFQQNHSGVQTSTFQPLVGCTTTKTMTSLNTKRNILKS